MNSWVRCLLFGAILYAHNISAQLTPCSEKEISAKQQLEICSAYRPVSGYLLVQTTKGAPCSCDCSAFPQVYPSIDSLEARIGSYPARKLSWMNAFASTTSACTSEDLRFKVSADHDQVISCRKGELCEIDERTAMIAQRAIEALASTSVGSIHINGSSCDPNSSPINIGDLDVEKNWNSCALPGNDYSSRITIPRRFLDHPYVGEELIVFFILHEAAHLQCNERSEVECDQWAIRTGLPLFFGHQWTPEFSEAYVERIICQFGEYFSDVYTPIALSQYRVCAGVSYPPLTCRLSLITKANFAYDPFPMLFCQADTMLCKESPYSESIRLRECSKVCYACQGDYSITSGVSRTPFCPECVLIHDIPGIWQKCPGPYPFCSLPPLIFEKDFFNRTNGGTSSQRRLNRWRRKADKLHSKLETRF